MRRRRRRRRLRAGRSLLCGSGPSSAFPLEDPEAGGSSSLSFFGSSSSSSSPGLFFFLVLCFRQAPFPFEDPEAGSSSSRCAPPSAAAAASSLCSSVAVAAVAKPKQQAAAAQAAALLVLLLSEPKPNVDALSKGSSSGFYSGSASLCCRLCCCPGGGAEGVWQGHSGPLLFLLLERENGDDALLAPPRGRGCGNSSNNRCLIFFFVPSCLPVPRGLWEVAPVPGEACEEGEWQQQQQQVDLSFFVLFSRGGEAKVQEKRKNQGEKNTIPDSPFLSLLEEKASSGWTSFRREPLSRSPLKPAMASPAASHESGELGELPPEEMEAEATTTTPSMHHRSLPPPPPLQQQQQQQHHAPRDRGGGGRRSGLSPPRREERGGGGRERGWDRERETRGGDGGRSRRTDGGGGDDLDQPYHRRGQRQHRSRSRSRSRERGGDRRGSGGGGGGGGRSNALLPPPPPLRQRSPTPPLENEDEAAARLEAALAGGKGGQDDEEDVEAQLVARRARRAAILAKYKEQEEEEEKKAVPSAAAAAAPPPPAEAKGANDNNGDLAATTEAELDADAAGASLFQHHEKEEAAAAAKAAAAARAAAAATKAKKEEEREKEATPDIFAEGDVPEEAFAPTNNKSSKGGGKGLADAFDDPEGYYKFQVGERMGPPISSASSSSTSSPVISSCSKEGRYEVFATHGKGVFSTVLRARDLLLASSSGGISGAGGGGGGGGGGPGGGDGSGDGNGDGSGAAAAAAAAPSATAEVAIKVIRANELMRRAGALEASILERLAAADPAGKRHCVRLLSRFDHRGHLCLVFEPLDSDLRALAARYGRGVGLSLAAARAYATQLLLALSHVASCGIVHADVKPDNVLVSKDRSRVVLADFGSALVLGGDNEVTPYLVSRFYRAPEIILGLRYSYPCDVWSLGCLLFELYTGKVAFPGRTNNEMLAMFQAMKGPIPKKMVRKGAFSGRHFELVHPHHSAGTGGGSGGGAGGGGGGGNEQYAFAAIRDDPISGRPMRTVVQSPRVEADVAARLHAAAAVASSSTSSNSSAAAEERADVAALADLLERMFALDPERRITAKEALRHPFIARGLGGGGGGGGAAGAAQRNGVGGGARR